MQDTIFCINILSYIAWSSLATELHAFFWPAVPAHLYFLDSWAELALCQNKLRSWCWSINVTWNTYSCTSLCSAYFCTAATHLNAPSHSLHCQLWDIIYILIYILIEHAQIFTFKHIFYFELCQTFSDFRKKKVSNCCGLKNSLVFFPCGRQVILAFSLFNKWTTFSTLYRKTSK